MWVPFKTVIMYIDSGWFHLILGSDCELVSEESRSCIQVCQRWVVYMMPLRYSINNVCIHAYACKCIHTHARTHARTHTHTHTHTQTLMFFSHTLEYMLETTIGTYINSDPISCASCEPSLHHSLRRESSHLSKFKLQFIYTI